MNAARQVATDERGEIVAGITPSILREVRRFSLALAARVRLNDFDHASDGLRAETSDHAERAAGLTAQTTTAMDATRLPGACGARRS